MSTEVVSVQEQQHEPRGVCTGLQNNIRIPKIQTDGTVPYSRKHRAMTVTVGKPTKMLTKNAATEPTTHVGTLTQPV